MTLTIRASRSRRTRLGRDYTRRLLDAAPFALYPCDEPTGDLALCSTNHDLDAAYGGAGIAYAADTDGPFRTPAPTFDGNLTYIAEGSAAFDALWNGDLFSMISWGRVDGSARWTDATTYRYLQHLRSQNDDLYYVVMGKSSNNHELQWRRRTGGAIALQTYTYNPAGTLDWFCMGMTHDQSAPVLNFYLWDSVSGFQTLAPNTGAVLTAWGDNPVTNPAKTCLMAGGSTGQAWIGAGAHHAVWNRMLSGAEMQYLMTP
jgi:hypothetical protein